MPESCFICDKHARGEAVDGGVIWQDDLVYAGHCHLLDREDIHLGWLVVEPTRHVYELGDLTTEEASAIGVLVSRLAKALTEIEGAEHVYSFVLGDGMGKGHLHVHLMARYPGTPPEFWQQRVVEWPDGPRGGQPEMKALVARLREHLAAPTEPSKRGGPRSAPPSASPPGT